ncbi:Multidrug resistance protein MdtC [Vibrio stylophorae]|uniref:Multidrug resistance protein MdtC n=1 Tax=Vibrio stylophorae TaxID=659351 RepID=A0ABM8ZSX2_9VIBR|nr:efflux RND transporter permease subunit [Vibrio stylophorae]CAH0533408.1 Multidrug resistance protein MdtC [Vibrio stylophorae]
MRAILSNTRLLILMIGFIVVAGLSAISALPRAEDPRFHNRWGSVIVGFPGNSAERVEALVTEKVENSLRQIAEIREINSISKPGIAVVSLKLQENITNTDEVWADIRDQVADVAPTLPEGSLPPRVDKDHSFPYTTIVALKWRGDSPINLLTLGRYGQELAKQLRISSGTEFVDQYGIPDEEILVQIDPALLASLGQSALSMSQNIGYADAKLTAGELLSGQNRFQLEMANSIDSIDRIKRIPITVLDSGHVLRIEDIATVSRSAKNPPDELAYIGDAPAVLIGARMQPNLRVDRWSENIRAQLDSFASQLPENIELQILFEQEGYTQIRLHELVQNLLFGMLLIIAILLLTLGFRAALIVAASLPLTCAFTLAMMKFTHLPIDQMSVTGLIVALGIMVDNAIVMVDTIQNHRRQGDRPIEAAYKAIQHLWLPLLGSTLTTVLSFAPIFLMPGSAGEFVAAIAITVSFSLVGSYLISHTIVAGVAGRLLGKTELNDWYHRGIQWPWLTAHFRQALYWATRHPALTIVLVSILPVAGFWSASQLTEQFFPPADRDMFEVRLYLPPQANIYATTEMIHQANTILSEFDALEQVSWMAGNNAPSFYYNQIGGDDGSVYFAQAMVKTTDVDGANDMIPKLQQALDSRLPGVQSLVRKLNQGPPYNAPIEVRVLGNDLDTLRQIGDELRLRMSRIEHVMHTRATLAPGVPKIWIDVNEEASQVSGWALTPLSQILHATLSGELNGNIIEQTELIPIRVRVGNEQRHQLSDLANMPLPTGHGTLGLSVDALADLSVTPSRGAIPRRNGSRVNVIEGYIEADVLPQTILNQLQANLATHPLMLPDGYRLEFGGESQERNDSVKQLMANLALVIALLILVVVLSFNSFRLSTIIFMVGGQAAGLGILSVWLFQYPFGFTVLIGLLGLMGLAINSAIVILAELQTCPAAQQGDHHAVIDCVMSCTRHISSTTITTVGGFLPLILAGGGFWPPFAVAIAGGTVFTTILSFFFVPAAYRFAMLKKKKLVNATV